jgi:hypothetical protein
MAKCPRMSWWAKWKLSSLVSSFRQATSMYGTLLTAPTLSWHSS